MASALAALVTFALVEALCGQILVRTTDEWVGASQVRTHRLVITHKGARSLVIWVALVLLATVAIGIWAGAR